MHNLCQEGLQWDRTVSEMYQKKWECCKNDLIGREKIELKRCIKPGDFGKIVRISLHSFSDASELGYGESSYLRLVDEYGHIHCTFDDAKVTPRKSVSLENLFISKTLFACCGSFSRKNICLDQIIIRSDISDLESKKQIKVGSVITKEDFVSSLETCILVD